MTLDVVTSVLILLLFAVTCLVFTLGLLGEFGVLRPVRCPECDRLGMRWRSRSDPRCATCRHEHLAHPLRTAMHPVRELAHR